MPSIVRVTSTHHCFKADSKALDTEVLSKIPRSGGFTLDEFDLSLTDFDGLPDRPSDFVEGTSLCPFENIARQDSDDAEGSHMYWLFRLKTSGVILIAGLADNQVDHFARRWSSDWIYSPFQRSQDITLEEAERISQETAFETLHKFLNYFVPFCRQTLHENHDIYVMWEAHHYYHA